MSRSWTTEGMYSHDLQLIASVMVTRQPNYMNYFMSHSCSGEDINPMKNINNKI